MIHPDKKGGEKFLWQGNLDIPSFRSIVVKITTQLKTEQKNIYAQQWPNWAGQSFSQNFSTENPTQLTSQLTYDSVQESGDMLLKGWVFPSSIFQLAPAHLVVVHQDTIIGIGLPYSDRNLKKPAIPASLSNLFNILPRPLGTLSGVSNYYYTQINTAVIGTNGFDKEAITLYGIYPDKSFTKLSLPQ